MNPYQRNRNCGNSRNLPPLPPSGPWAEAEAVVVAPQQWRTPSVFTMSPGFQLLSRAASGAADLVRISLPRHGVGNIRHASRV